MFFIKVFYKSNI